MQDIDLAAGVVATHPAGSVVGSGDLWGAETRATYSLVHVQEPEDLIPRGGIWWRRAPLGKGSSAEADDDSLWKEHETVPVVPRLQPVAADRDVLPNPVRVPNNIWERCAGISQYCCMIIGPLIEPFVSDRWPRKVQGRMM